MASKERRIGGKGSLTSCGCPLVFVGQVWHRIIINNEYPSVVSRDLGIGKHALRGIVRILQHCKRVPTKARLALIALRTPDVTPEDIVDWFDEPLWWVHDVMDNADKIREREHIPAQLEYYDEGYQPSDPTPAEIREKCLEIRSKEDRTKHVPYVIPHLQWTGEKFEEFSDIAE